MNQRPTGVTILAILAFIAGAFGILGALALLGLGIAFAGVATGGLSFVFGIVFLAISILYLWIGWGFWNLKRSAWSIGLVVFGVSVALVDTAEGFVIGATLGAVLFGIGLIVLIVSALLYASS